MAMSPFTIVMIAILAWMATSGPVRHVGRAVLIWAQGHPGIMSKIDPAEWQPVRRSNWAIRVFVGILVGYSVLGLSLYPTTLRLRELPPPESARLIAQYNSNNPESPGQTTSVIAGFPWRGIEGDGGGGFQGYLPADRGMDVLWCNWAVLTAVALILSSLLPTRWLRTALLASYALAIYGSLQLVNWCTYYWD